MSSIASAIRIPDDYLCFDPPDAAPAVGPLPAFSTGRVTFGCFNVPAKITPRVIEVWAEILRRVPQSCLLLKNLGLDDPGTASRLVSVFAGQGIQADRLKLMGWSSADEAIAAYQGVDIALDPFPFNGGLTTCDALWMGVPVVTCPGETFASRQGLTHLTTIGLTECIADNLDHYIETAVALANDLPRLASLRAGLRERMSASPLRDGKCFAAHFSKLMRRVWQDQLNKTAAAPA